MWHAEVQYGKSQWGAMTPSLSNFRGIVKSDRRLEGGKDYSRWAISHLAAQASAAVGDQCSVVPAGAVDSSIFGLRAE